MLSGHSITVEELSLRPLTSLEDCPKAVHGTFRKNLSSILRTGLKPMTRQHIHFSKMEPPASGVDVSGIRGTCDVLIFLDVEKALRGGIALFESTNGVILSPGGAAGCIEPGYFAKVVDRGGVDLRETS